jgi:TRAP-type C4-dicarboxylate transport system permease small subunit
MVKLENIIFWISDKLNWIALVGIVVMMVLTTLDVIGRFVFNSPIEGNYDITGLIGLSIVAAAMSRTQFAKGHVAVDFLIRFFKPRLRAAVESTTFLISIILFGLIAWYGFFYGNALLAAGEVSQTVKIPFAPFAYIISISFLALCLALVIDFAKSIREVFKR